MRKKWESNNHWAINDCNLLKPWKASSENDLTLFESNTQTHCWNETECEMNKGMIESSEVFKTREITDIKWFKLVRVHNAIKHKKNLKDDGKRGAFLQAFLRQQKSLHKPCRIRCYAEYWKMKAKQSAETEQFGQATHVLKVNEYSRRSFSDNAIA